MRFKASLLRKKGINLPYGPSDPTPSQPATSRFSREDHLEMKYFIAADEKKREDITLLMYASVNEPAYQVRLHILYTSTFNHLVYFRTSVIV